MTAEEMRKELENALLAESPRSHLVKLKNNGSLGTWIPELTPTYGFDQHHPAHQEDLFTHTLSVLEMTPEDLLLRWTALLHDIAKPKTQRIGNDGVATYHGHAEASAKMGATILHRFGYDQAFIDAVTLLVHHHMTRSQLSHPGSLKKLEQKLGTDLMIKLICFYQADALAHASDDNIAEVKRIEQQFRKWIQYERMTEMDLAVIKEQINKKSEQWKAIAESKGENKGEADQFYVEGVFPLVEKYFVHKEKEKVASVYKGSPVEGMILSLGTSPEPLILSVLAFKPKNVLFLYTEESKVHLDRIQQETGLSLLAIEKRRVDTTDLTDIYRICYEQWVEWGQSDRVLVDITGGTKAMSAGLMSVAGILNLQVVTITSKNFLKSERRPEPGSEYIEFLVNPLNVSGALKRRDAKKYFEYGDYAYARMLYEELKGRMDPEKNDEINFHLADAYAGVDALSFDRAKKAFDRINQQANRYRDCLTNTEWEQIERQREIVTMLDHYLGEKSEDNYGLLEDREAVGGMLAVLYLNAKRRAMHERFDTASLLLYRLLEVLEQRRFARRGVSTADMKYEILLRDKDQSDFLERLNGVRRLFKYNEMDSIEEIGNKVSLVMGFQILEALDDEFSIARHPETKEKPKAMYHKFKNSIDSRNTSVLAHGFHNVDKKEYLKFLELVEGYLFYFCQIESLDMDKLATTLSPVLVD